jgi:hypothetical protein
VALTWYMEISRDYFGRHVNSGNIVYLPNGADLLYSLPELLLRESQSSLTRWNTGVNGIAGTQ